MTLYGWCAVPTADEMYHVFLHAGSFDEAEFTDYYMMLAGGHLVALPQNTISFSAMLTHLEFEGLFGYRGLWKCQCCHLCTAVKMQGCQKCFVRYCSVQCQRNDWSLHKPFCRTFTTLRGTKYASSGRKARNLAQIISILCVAFEFRLFKAWELLHCLVSIFHAISPYT